MVSGGYFIQQGSLGGRKSIMSQKSALVDIYSSDHYVARRKSQTHHNHVLLLCLPSADNIQGFGTPIKVLEAGTVQSTLLKHSYSTTSLIK
jgi:hypothetical protein